MKKRILLVSDMHYTTDTMLGEMGKRPHTTLTINFIQGTKR